MPKIDLTQDDQYMVTLAGAYGLSVGALLPLDGPVDPTVGLPGVLGSAGALSAMLLANHYEFGADVTTAGYAGAGYGALAGLGASMLAVPRNSDCGDADENGDYDFGWDCGVTWSQQARILRLGSLGAGTAGMLGGAYLAHHNPAGINPDDVILSGVTAGWTAWQAAGWYDVLEVDERWEGAILLLPALAGGGVALASPELNISLGHSLSALSVGLWGTYIGSVVGILTDESETLRAALIGSDIGLAAGVGAMLPAVGTDPVIVGVANAGGVVGASVAALVTSFVTAERDPILVGSLIGAGVGAVGGTVLGLRYASQISNAVGKLDVPMPAFARHWTAQPATFLNDDRSVAYGASIHHRGW
jgi:hypothetical protein